MPPGIIGIMLTLEGISIPALHFSASNISSKQPVPPLQSWPSMMFSLGPCRRSSSECAAASIRMSTWEEWRGGEGREERGGEGGEGRGREGREERGGDVAALPEHTGQVKPHKK